MCITILLPLTSCPLPLKYQYDMRYIKPASRVESAQVVNMLAESLAINGDTTVNGGDALTKENDWAIWSDED